MPDIEREMILCRSVSTVTLIGQLYNIGIVSSDIIHNYIRSLLDPNSVFVLTEKIKKLDRKSRLMVFIGYDEESKAFRMVDPRTNELQISQDVRRS